MILRHACAFCIALQRLAIRRRDLAAIEAAARLSAAHLAADAERQAFARSAAGATADALRAGRKVVHENGPSRRR